MGSSNGDVSLGSSRGLKAVWGRGCLRAGTPSPFSADGEGGTEDSVERAANQGYSLTVSFQTFGSVTWCMMVYTASIIMYASTKTKYQYELPMKVRIDLHINVTAHAKASRTWPERHIFAAILPVASTPMTCERSPCGRATGSVTYLDAVRSGCSVRSPTVPQHQL